LTAVFDEPSIVQAVRNLIANAVDAMPSGGRVDVTLSQDPEGVQVRVADQGPGIRPDLRQRVFTPFFTTKSRGTGLGLAIVAKAASMHGGRAAVAPSEKGAVFNLWLPNVNHQQQE
jgi:signal transduction histidine kinase